MVQPERIRRLNDEWPRGGDYVLYWMQASQRAECNHALEWAVRRADELGQPTVAVFGLTDKYPEANERHYAFLLEGLRETQEVLRRRGVQLVVRRAWPALAALQLAEQASVLVTDRGYTRHQKAWRRHVAKEAPCQAVQVESEVIVPVETASDKQEYAAATLRPKLHRHLKRYLVPLEQGGPKRDSLGLRFESVVLDDVDALLGGMSIDRTARRVKAFVGGGSEANRLLQAFIAKKLQHYASRRNDPSLDIQSHQSPYLHFGQTSALLIALKVAGARGVPQAAKDAYLEELIVRRELAVNFVHYNPQYGGYACLPDWARRTLEEHGDDVRPAVYTLRQLEGAETGDRYWNAAMREMLLTGKMHNYMRMYWGKKILEWSGRPEQAFRTLLYLNNKYFLCGRDPNGWANVAWCFGLHDRPWKERPVFGKVRYMNAAGLERKFDMSGYLRKVEPL